MNNILTKKHKRQLLEAVATGRIDPSILLNEAKEFEPNGNLTSDEFKEMESLITDMATDGRFSHKDTVMNNEEKRAVFKSVMNGSIDPENPLTKAVLARNEGLMIVSQLQANKLLESGAFATERGKRLNDLLDKYFGI